MYPLYYIPSVPYLSLLANTAFCASSSLTLYMGSYVLSSRELLLVLCGYNIYPSLLLSLSAYLLSLSLLLPPLLICLFFSLILSANRHDMFLFSLSPLPPALL